MPRIGSIASGVTKILGEAQFKRVGVIPVRGERCIIPDLLAQRSHADISGGSYPFGLRRLLEMLRHYSRDDNIAIPQSPPLEVSEFSKMLPIVVPIGIEVSADLIPLFETTRTVAIGCWINCCRRCATRLPMSSAFRFQG